MVVACGCCAVSTEMWEQMSVFIERGRVVSSREVGTDEKDGCGARGSD